MLTTQMFRFSRTWIVAAAIVGVCAATPRRASAQVDGDFRAGVNVDANSLTIGGGVLMDVNHRGEWYFNPNLEASLSNNVDRLSMNGDFHYDFDRTPSASVYLGGGPAVLSRSDNTDLGLNLLVGLAGRHGDVRPFAQMKGVLANNDELVLMGGVRF